MRKKLILLALATLLGVAVSLPFLLIPSPFTKYMDARHWGFVATTLSAIVSGATILWVRELLEGD